jgi:hypothetical protein
MHRSQRGLFGHSEQYQCLSVAEKMQVHLKPLRQEAQGISCRVDFRIGFRNKKKRTVLLGFILGRKSILMQFFLDSIDFYDSKSQRINISRK